MKDLPHHIKKLNRRVVRSAHREEMEEEQWDTAGNWKEEYKRARTKKQKKKQAKENRKQSKEAHLPHPPDEEERNREMKRRTPIRKPRSHNPPST